MNKMAEVPVIDMSSLFGDDDQEKLKVARAIDEICRGHGFFYVSNHGIDLQELQYRTTEFHRLLTDEEKWHHAINAYNASNRHIRSGYYMAVEGNKANESFCYLSPRFHSGHHLIQSKRPLHEVNDWPLKEERDEFKTYYENFYTDVFNVSSALLKAFALALGKQERFFDPFFDLDTTMSAVSLIRYPYLKEYPPVKVAEDGTKLSFGAHQDVSLITVLYQTAVPNLQLEINDIYHDVPVSEDYFLVNCGTFMAHMTNNYYHAPWHRVKFINAERLSIPFFVNLSYDALIEPFHPGDQSDRENNPTISYGEFYQAGSNYLISANGQT